MFRTNYPVHAMGETTLRETYVNPLFKDIVKESDLSESVSPMPVAGYAEETYLTSIEAAGAQMREEMRNREEEIVIYYQAPEYSRELVEAIANQALVHTGKPDEGDYLKWQFAGWKTETTYKPDEDMLNLTIVYTYTYYTTYEQEKAVSDKVDEVLDELKINEKKQYDKVKAIYDYICEHTVYDHENLNDNSYKLKYTAYAALINEKAVCQGYALLFYRMALESGADSRLISGLGNGGAHGWNIVQINGKYYNIDATWDAGVENYQYFLKCEEHFQGHVRDGEYASEEFLMSYPMAQEDYQIKDEQEISAPEIISVYSRVQNSAKVTWTNVEDADGYELFRAIDPNAAETQWQLVKTIKNGDIVQYTNVNLEVGTTYYYKIRAYIGSEEGTRQYSEFSEVNYMPAAVVFNNLYSNDVSRIRILWNEVQGSHGYQIWRQDENGEYKIVKTLGDKGNILTDNQGSTVAYSNTGLKSGKVYVYKMRAFSIIDEKKVFGAYSDEFKVAAMPQAPQLRITNVKADRVELQWNPVNGAAGYQIWRAAEGTEKYDLIKSITDSDTLIYVNRNLESGSTYSYKIRAYTEIEEKKTFGAFSEAERVATK